MYWASGASHGPHQVPKEWADKYKGKFDDGWDKYRERAFQRAKRMGWIPKDAKLTPRPANLAVVGLDPRRRETLSTPVDGSVSPGSPSTWTCRSAGSSTRSTGSATARTRSSFTSGATTARPPKARTARSANCSRRTAFRPRRNSRSRRSTPSAASTCSDRPRPTTCITPAGPGPAARRTNTPS